MTDLYDKKLQQMMDGSLDPVGFAHRDHLGVAFAALQQYEFFQALLIYSKGLRALTVKAGLPEKYNATVTFAFFSLIAEKMHGKETTFDVFLAENPDLLSIKVLKQLYGPDIPTSQLARNVALLPFPKAA